MSLHLTSQRDEEGKNIYIGQEWYERGPNQSIYIIQNVREGREVIQWEASSEVRHMDQKKGKWSCHLQGNDWGWG